MAVVLMNAKKVRLLAAKLPFLRGLAIRLYQNNHVPAAGDTSANFTEATFPGYVSQTLVSLGTAFLNGSNQAESDTNVLVWTCTGTTPSNLIYGYYVTDGDGEPVFADRDPAAPTTLNTPGQTFTVQIAFLDDQL